MLPVFPLFARKQQSLKEMRRREICVIVGLCTIPTGSQLTSAEGYTEDSILMFHLASTIILSFFFFFLFLSLRFQSLSEHLMLPALQLQLQLQHQLIIMPPICLSGRHLKWSPLSLSQHRCKAGNSGEHSCAASLVNDGNCSCLTEFNNIKAQQEMEIAASGRGSPGVVISISASSGCKGTILMNVCFSVCREAFSCYCVLEQN